MSFIVDKVLSKIGKIINMFQWSRMNIEMNVKQNIILDNKSNIVKQKIY
jgi:hypothetical protein